MQFDLYRIQLWAEIMKHFIIFAVLSRSIKALKNLTQFYKSTLPSSKQKVTILLIYFTINIFSAAVCCSKLCKDLVKFWKIRWNLKVIVNNRHPMDSQFFVHRMLASEWRFFCDCNDIKDIVKDFSDQKKGSEVGNFKIINYDNL